MKTGTIMTTSSPTEQNAIKLRKLTRTKFLTKLTNTMRTFSVNNHEIAALATVTGDPDLAKKTATVSYMHAIDKRIIAEPMPEYKRAKEQFDAFEETKQTQAYKEALDKVKPQEEKEDFALQAHLKAADLGIRYAMNRNVRYQADFNKAITKTYTLQKKIEDIEAKQREPKRARRSRSPRRDQKRRRYENDRRNNYRNEEPPRRTTEKPITDFHQVPSELKTHLKAKMQQMTNSTYINRSWTVKDTVNEAIKSVWNNKRPQLAVSVDTLARNMVNHYERITGENRSRNNRTRAPANPFLQ